MKTFNMDEIFEIAEQIERNGADFYRKAADGLANEEHKQKLLELAEMELSHERTFADMRAEYREERGEQPTFDPAGEAARYLGKIADGQVFDMDPASAEDLAEKTIDEILKRAIDLEKDSIVFYIGIEELVPPEMGREKIAAIIHEEMGHITLLSEELAALKR